MEILICFGTRPEYIKIKSLIDNLTEIPIRTLFTGQHTDLLNDIQVDYAINITNNSDNRINNIISSILSFNLPSNITHVLIQGDTASAFATALSAFNNNKVIIHLEAGLRTYDRLDPYPEESYRQMISRIASIHLCPTELNKNNLLQEKIDTNRYDINNTELKNSDTNIFVVGNTGLDNINKYDCRYNNKVLITMHRRNNICNISNWFKTFTKIASKYPDIEFILPIHPNPEIRKHSYLLKNITVMEPVSHDELINILKECKFVISDSGGIQEEASLLNKKIIVCRKGTERPEILGINSILCDNYMELEQIVEHVNNNYVIESDCPYHDGNPSWLKIKDVLVGLNK